MAYRLLAIDVDGTLVKPDLTISTVVQKHVRAAIDRNVMVTLATGRHYASAAYFARQLGLTIPLILYNGALVREMGPGCIYYHRPVPLPLARNVIAIARDLEVHIQIYLHERMYVHKLDEKALFSARLGMIEAEAVGELHAWLREDPVKLIAVDEPEKLQQMAERIRAVCGDELWVGLSQPGFLEINHACASKGRGLAELARRLGISPGEVIAIGDNYNDLDMLQFAGCGVAMGNAPEDVKARADYVTRSNTEDGVAEVIAQFVLKEGSR